MASPGDFKIQYKLTWDEYGQLVEDLWSDLKAKLAEKNLKVDAIIVVLREGVFTSIPLAYKLNTYKVIPIQFKYMLLDGSNELKQLSSIPDVSYQLPESPLLLLCDTFPAGGETKNLVIKEFKKKYPQARFVFASLIQDESIRNNADILFGSWAVSCDESGKTTHPIYTKSGVTNVLYTLLPWENEGEELAGPEKTKWDYN